MKKNGNGNIKSQKIFLTGERGVGKSTIINQIVHDMCTQLDLTLVGFQTLPGAVSADNSEDKIFIIPYGKYQRADLMDASSLQCKSTLPNPAPPHLKPVAIRDKKNQSFTAYPEIFDTLGVEILKMSQAQENTIIVMDELGFMESEAYAFQSEVLKILDHSATVIGVIKPKHTNFLDRIRNHKDVTVVTVTEENRDSIISVIYDIIS
ncbi:MAG: nucleoside-triphosphatase [Clostridiales Family XIII bacterium]|jgi:nucleoside-triphosphatase THEP1|nr:nucleoside-triphosphatase [Clostridiales Family XIII bacterium]